MHNQWSALLDVSTGSLLQIYQTVSKSDSNLTMAIPPQTLTLPPTPSPAIPVEFCNMTTGKLLLIDANATFRLWINKDPLLFPLDFILVNQFLFVAMDFTSVFLQHPGGMTPITAKVTVVGI